MFEKKQHIVSRLGHGTTDPVGGQILVEKITEQQKTGKKLVFVENLSSILGLLRLPFSFGRCSSTVGPFVVEKNGVSKPLQKINDF